MQQKGAITMKRISLVLCVMLAFITVFVGMGEQSSAASLEKKALKKYASFVKGKKGYYSWQYVKGRKAPVLLLAKKYTSSYSGKNKGRYAVSNCKMYAYEKGKVRQIKTVLKTKYGKMDMLATNGTAYKIMIYKHKLIVPTSNAIRELYIKGDNLYGKGIWNEKGTSIYNQYNVKNGKVSDNKRISSKKGKRFMKTRYNKAKYPLFKKIK